MFLGAHKKEVLNEQDSGTRESNGQVKINNHSQ